MKQLRRTCAFLLYVALSSPAVHAANEKTLPQLPASMLGDWGWSAQSCAIRNDDGRVTISPREISFFAARYRLENIFPQPDGAIIGRARTNEEDEPGTGRNGIRLRLAGKDSLTIVTDALAHVYVRCAGRLNKEKPS